MMMFQLKAVKAVTRKSRYYDTKARTGIMKSDCTKPRETRGTIDTRDKHRHNTQEEKHTEKSWFLIRSRSMGLCRNYDLCLLCMHACMHACTLSRVPAVYRMHTQKLIMVVVL